MKDNEWSGETIEGYHVVTELGFSSAHRSFLGERRSPTAPHERVVVKLWSAAAENQTQQELENLLQELAQLQKLSHPHILPVLSTGRHKDIPYSLTEYVTSGSLYDLLQRKSPGQPLQEEQALSLLAQLGQALHYAHQQQIVHGRLKPHNVLFKTSDHVLVSDFQLETLLSPEKVGKTYPSDLSMYLAPEQLAGETTPKSDQYALGCLAYEMLTGTKVFMIPSVNTPGKYYKTKSLILPRHLNLALSIQMEEAILTTLSRDPAQRFEDIPAFLAALGLSATTKEKKQEKKAAAAEQIIPIAIIPAVDVNNARTEEVESLPREVAEAQLASKTRSNVPFPPTRQGLSRARKRVLAVILCLLALIIGAGALADLELPHPSPTVSMRSSAPTSVPATSIATTPTPSGISLPPHRTPIVHHTVMQPNASANILPTPVPTLTPAPTPTPSTKLAQISLSAFFNNKGIGNQPSGGGYGGYGGYGGGGYSSNASQSGVANFDNSGYSYPANQLPSGSSITVNGVPYQFPTIAPGTNDNIVAFGQTISLTSGHYQQADLLMASTWGPVTGTITIQYTDGSSSTTNLTVPDWLYGSTPDLRTSYRYSPNGIDQQAAYIYAITLPVDSTRTANALVLPSQLSGQYNNAELHVFALTVLP